MGPSTSTYQVTEWTLWFGLLGSGVAWFIHLAAVYALAEAVCQVGFLGYTVLGIHSSTLAIVLITAVAVAVAAASALTAYRNRQRLKQEAESNVERVSRGAGIHVAHGGVYLGIFFIVTILAQLFPVFFMQPCP